MLNVALAPLTLLSTLWCVTLLYSTAALAGPPRERIALMLTGSNCREVQQNLATTLRITDGVFAVDGGSVPQHLLIDIEEGKISTHDILTIVQTSAGALSCQIAIMQSCITAPRLTKTNASAK